MRRAGLERLGVRTQTGTNGQQRAKLLILCPLVTVHVRTQVVSASPGTGRSSYKRAAPFLFRAGLKITCFYSRAWGWVRVFRGRSQGASLKRQLSDSIFETRS